MNPKYDGECHPISKEFAYIAKRIEFREYETLDFQDIHEQLLKYAEYLYDNDKKKILAYLMDKFNRQVRNFCTDESYQMIFKPSWLVSCLDQYGVLILKFKRAENDNLGSEYEHE